MHNGACILAPLGLMLLVVHRWVKSRLAVKAGGPLPILVKTSWMEGVRG